VRGRGRGRGGRGAGPPGRGWGSCGRSGARPGPRSWQTSVPSLSARASAGRERSPGDEMMGAMRANLHKDPSQVASMFDEVAQNYDLTNDVLSLGIDRLWRRATFDAVAGRPGQRVLDLAAGTGTSSAPYADAGIDVVPCDFSAGMVAVGKQRRPDLPFIVGD